MKLIKKMIIILLLVDSMLINNKSYASVFLVENNMIDNGDFIISHIYNPYFTNYVFIYSKENQWINENILGNCGCEEGYLYVKNIKENTIRKIVNIKPTAFCNDE